VWSEGLGWYALIVAETLELLPREHPAWPRVLEIAQRLAAGLRQTQDHQAGLWYQVVDKGDRDDNWHDTSGSAMFVYFLQRMIDLGYLDAEQYRPSVERGYAGIVGKMAIGSGGLVDIYDACDGVCVQRSYADYVYYPRRINAKEALGSVLWAATIVEKPSCMQR
jgi:unsaturated rhamnogalacturonyl hydrolase